MQCQYKNDLKKLKGIQKRTTNLIEKMKGSSLWRKVKFSKYMYPDKSNMVNIYVHLNIAKTKENKKCLWLQIKLHLRIMGIQMSILSYLSSAWHYKDLCFLGPSACSLIELTIIRVLPKDTHRNELEMSWEN